MCGRFSLTIDLSDLQDAFPGFIFPAEAAPRFNIAPTQPILILPNDGSHRTDFYTWGLIPSWAKDPSMGVRLINARAETLSEKPAFRSAYKYRRCLIFADGFFEWQTSLGGKKTPYFIRLRSALPFAFAGLWENWSSPDGSEIRSAAIITTWPNDLIAPIHDRMPVIVHQDAYAKWLDLKPQQPEILQPLLVPYPAGEMTAFRVSTLVNSPANDLPQTVLPTT